MERIKDMLSASRPSKNQDEIVLLNGDVFQKDHLLEKMRDDDFYYNWLSRDIALSASSIKDLVPPKSPKAWYYGNGKPESDTALRAGILFHNAILEPEKYDKLKFSKLKTRTAKGFRDEQSRINEPLYTANEKAFNDRLVSEFTVNKRAMSKLSGADFEVPLFGYIEGLPFRGKADIITPDGRILDLKTTGNLEDFPKSAYSFSYDVQCYIYATLMGADPLGCEFLVISKNTYDIGFFEVDRSFIDQGKDKLMRAIEVYKQIFWKKSDDEIRETLNELSFDNKLYSREKYHKK